uniref:Uncharacterized protein n=1 Tax=Cacopsylla melanoneura TaxID=428564 RepID=A0A8D9B0U2_9HEMI
METMDPIIPASQNKENKETIEQQKKTTNIEKATKDNTERVNFLEKQLKRGPKLDSLETNKMLICHFIGDSPRDGYCSWWWWCGCCPFFPPPPSFCFFFFFEQTEFFDCG